MHCFLEDVSQSSKISVLPMSVINFFDFSLNLFISSVLFKSCRKTPFSGDSRTAQSTFWPFLCDSCPVVGLQNEVCLVFCSRHCRCGFHRNFFPMRFGGLKIFLLLDQADPVVHFANSASLGDWYTLWKSSSLVSMHTALSIQIANSVL